MQWVKEQHRLGVLTPGEAETRLQNRNVRIFIWAHSKQETLRITASASSERVRGCKRTCFVGFSWSVRRRHLREEQKASRIGMQVTPVQRRRPSSSYPMNFVALENFFDTRPAKPSAPVPNNARVDGSGTGDLPVVSAVAEKVTGPLSCVLKVKLPGVSR